jgi:hypothetical protein
LATGFWGGASAGGGGGVHRVLDGRGDRPLHRLSFAGTVDRLNALAPYLWLYDGTPRAETLYNLLLTWIAGDRVPDRPNRVEPRAVKRRPKEYDRLNRLRDQMRKALVRK